MSKVVKLPTRVERGAHLSGEAFCSQCRNEWVAVVSIGTVEIECPNCETMKGLLKYGCEPDVAWTCNCGCYVYMISPNGAICWNCGEYARGFEI